MVKVPSFTPSAAFPQLCEQVTIDWDEKRGRFVRALEDIPIGTVVCVETGITVNIDPQKCYRCLETTGDAEYAFRYCLNCKEFDEPTELACGVFDQLGIFKLAAHLVFAFSFADISELVQSEDPKIPTCAPSSLSTSDINSILHLTPLPEVNDAFKVKPIQNAIITIVNLLEADVNWSLLNPEARLYAFTKALRIMAERCPKNAHAIYSIEQKENNNEGVPMGTGLFPISSIFNHSCDPNVFGFFVGNTFIFVSRGVRAGEELVDSYGVTYQQNTMKQRTKFLANVSGFACHCFACSTQKNKDELLEKSFNNIKQCASEAQCLTDIDSYLDFMKPGSKDMEKLILAFASRWDAEIYAKKTFELWRQFVKNAKIRGITHDPYLIRPYLEMMVLAYTETEVEVSDAQRTSYLIMAQRLLKNFYVGLHPLSAIVEALYQSVQKKERERDIRNWVDRLKIRMRLLWKTDDPSLNC